MDDRMSLEEGERLKNLDGKPSNKIMRKSSKLMLLQKLVEVFVEDFESYAAMTPKNK